jgi:hypothetical protein
MSVCHSSYKAALCRYFHLVSRVVLLLAAVCVCRTLGSSRVQWDSVTRRPRLGGKCCFQPQAVGTASTCSCQVVSLTGNLTIKDTVLLSGNISVDIGSMLFNVVHQILFSYLNLFSCIIKGRKSWSTLTPTW